MTSRVKTPFASPRSVGPGKEITDVIVIGAGAAGLAAAKTLEKERPGTTVKVFEADDRIGGRAQTGQVGGNPVDLGCSWIHGSTANPLAPQVGALGFEAMEMAEDRLFIEGRPATPEEVERFEHLKGEFEENLERLSEAGIDISAKEALPSGDPLAKMVESYYGPLEASVDLDKASVSDVSNFNSGDDDILVKGGLGKLVQEYGKDVDVQLSTPVKEVKWRKGKVFVTTANGEVHAAKRLIITVSNGVLASGAIKFDPPLPQNIQKAIAGLPMGDMNKLIFAFDSNVFGDTESNTWVNQLASKDGSAQDNVGLLVRPEGQNVAVVFVGGEVARELEARGEDAARTLGLEKLKQMYGNGVTDHLVESHVTEWGKNQFSHGCYTAAKPGEAHQRDVLQTGFRGTRLAGEAATSPELCGSVGGAYQSGVDAAREIAQSLEQGGPRVLNLFRNLGDAVRFAGRRHKAEPAAAA